MRLLRSTEENWKREKMGYKSIRELKGKYFRRQLIEQ
jgi:hypothetical protein